MCSGYTSTIIYRAREGWIRGGYLDSYEARKCVNAALSEAVEAAKERARASAAADEFRHAQRREHAEREAGARAQLARHIRDRESAQSELRRWW